MVSAQRKEYLRNYQRKWVRRRRETWFAENGPCAKCNSWESLELDHIDPSSKIHHCVWSWSEERRVAELAKCQVLCYSCHKEKTRIEVMTIKHGTAMYRRGCKCKICKGAHASYVRGLRARRGRYANES